MEVTTCCHPSTLAFQSFATLEQPSWLPHGRHLEPGAPPGAFKSFIVRTDATSGAAPASLPCIPPSSLVFRWTLTDFLPLHVAGERPVPFLAPWSDQGRALRPDQEPADSSCIAIDDGKQQKAARPGRSRVLVGPRRPPLVTPRGQKWHWSLTCNRQGQKVSECTAEHEGGRWDAGEGSGSCT